MKLPELDEPQRYRGLFVFDFGDSTAVGYTAEEVAVLLESPEHRHGKVYRIERAWPDGRLELRGVAAERFQLESGMFFYRADADAARQDFAELAAAAEATPPPCRAFLHLAERPGAAAPYRHVAALIYPAECDSDVAAWLDASGFAGGDTAEGGISHVTNYYEEEKRIIERKQLWSSASVTSRSAQDVLNSVRRAVQR